MKQAGKAAGAGRLLNPVAMAILWLAGAAGVWAAESAAGTHEGGGQAPFLNAWLLLGPCPGGEVPGLETDFIGEAKAMPRAGCMAWIPNVLPDVCEGESLRIVKGEAGKEVHGGARALQVKGGKAGFHIHLSETGKGPDGTYRCWFFGRGTGKLTLSTYESSNKPGSGCPAAHGLIQIVELGREWREFVSTYKPSAKSDAKLSFVLAVPPGTVATLVDFEFWKE